MRVVGAIVVGCVVGCGVAAHDPLRAVEASVTPSAALAGQKVSVKAVFADSGRSREPVTVRVSVCPASNGAARDVDCIGEHVMLVGTAERSGEQLSFSFDYDVPAELPGGYAERLRVHAEREGEAAAVVASIDVLDPPDRAAAVTHAELVAQDGTTMEMTDGITVAPGLYRITAADVTALVVFCTDGCVSSYSTEVMSEQNVRFEGGDPTLLLLGIAAGNRPAIGRFNVHVR